MFKYNLHKRNADKCYCLGRSSNSISTKIRRFEIKNSYCEKLFGAKFDDKLNFDSHISDFCKQQVVK